MASISGPWFSGRNDRLILEAAARVLAEDPKATIQRIADEAGVVRLTVYRRYRDRDALRRAIFETAAAEAQRVIPDPDEGDPVEALRRLIIEMAAIAQRYPLISVGTDLEPSPGDTRMPAAPPQSREKRKAVLALVRRGQDEGRLRRDLPQAIVGTLRITLRFARSLAPTPGPSERRSPTCFCTASSRTSAHDNDEGAPDVNQPCPD